MKYIIIILLIIGCNFIHLQAITTKYTEKDINNVSLKINKKFSDTINLNVDFWLISNNLELENKILLNGNQNDYNKFNIILNKILVDVNNETSKILIYDTKSPNFIGLFKNQLLTNQIKDIVVNNILNTNIDSLFNLFLNISKPIANNTSNYTLNNKKTRFKTWDEVNAGAKANNLQSVTAEYGDVKNQEAIDAAKQYNTNEQGRVLENSYRHDSIEEARRLNALRGSERADVIEMQRKLQNSAGGTTSSGFTKSRVTAVYVPKEYEIKQPGFQAVPAPTYSKTTISRFNPNAGGSGGARQELNNYIYNTIINHYLILLSK
ncbi:MAG: hypothetical protein ACOVNU_12480 [Candidatus Kapaibacteriota bacterium]